MKQKDRGRKGYRERCGGGETERVRDTGGRVSRKGSEKERECRRDGG